MTRVHLTFTGKYIEFMDAENVPHAKRLLTQDANYYLPSAHQRKGRQLETLRKRSTHSSCVRNQLLSYLSTTVHSPGAPHTPHNDNNN
jgi:hypothetical protein